MVGSEKQVSVLKRKAACRKHHDRTTAIAGLIARQVQQGEIRDVPFSSFESAHVERRRQSYPFGLPPPRWCHLGS
jgi:hypothetical protein